MDKENENNITEGISAWLNNKEIYHTQLGELTLYLGQCASNPLFQGRLVDFWEKSHKMLSAILTGPQEMSC